jgi:hypothetical protein
MVGTRSWCISAVGGLDRFGFVPLCVPGGKLVSSGRPGNLPWSPNYLAGRLHPTISGRPCALIRHT